HVPAASAAQAATAANNELRAALLNANSIISSEFQDSVGSNGDVQMFAIAAEIFLVPAIGNGAGLPSEFFAIRKSRGPLWRQEIEREAAVIDLGIKSIRHLEARLRRSGAERADFRLVVNRAIGVERPHGHIPDVAAAADVRQVPLVEAIRAIIEPLRVGHEVVNAIALIDLIEF